MNVKNFCSSDFSKFCDHREEKEELGWVRCRQLTQCSLASPAVTKQPLLCFHDPFPSSFPPHFEGCCFFFFSHMDHFKRLYWICYNIASVCFGVFFFFFFLRGMWDLSSPTRDWTHTPCIRPRGKSSWWPLVMRSRSWLVYVCFIPCFSPRGTGRGAQNKRERTDLLGGPVVNTPHSQCKALHSIPCQGTRSHMLQLRVHMPLQRLKVPSAAAKTWHTQINKHKLNLKKEREKEKEVSVG